MFVDLTNRIHLFFEKHYSLQYQHPFSQGATGAAVFLDTPIETQRRTEKETEKEEAGRRLKERRKWRKNREVLSKHMKNRDYWTRNVCTRDTAASLTNSSTGCKADTTGRTKLLPGDGPAAAEPTADPQDAPQAACGHHYTFRNNFRVKRLPLIFFYLGTYGGGRRTFPFHFILFLNLFPSPISVSKY